MRIKLKRGESLSITAPTGATELRLAGAGKLVGPIEVVDGTAVITSAMTEDMPAGVYISEWKVVADDGTITLPSYGRIIVRESILTDNLRNAPVDQYERILKAAKDTLESAAASGDLSVSTGESSFSFESRSDLLSFINRLENKIALRKGRAPNPIVWRL